MIDLNTKAARDLPGPGTYDYSMLSGKDKSRGFSLGSSNRNALKGVDTSVPGPGQYESDAVKAKLLGGPKYSMYGRSKARLAENIPGPGAYSGASTDRLHGAPAFTLKGRDKHERRNDSPGPGQYNIESGYNLAHEQLPTYQLKGRMKNEPNSNRDNPGPG
jgi:hypothetical protein